jgi:ABC-type ATPase involved in cell division
VIRLRQVHKRYVGTRDVCALEGASMDVERGEVVLLAGGVGAGKTTLLSLLSGALWADEGVVEVFDHDVARLRRTSVAALRRQLGIVPETLALLPDRSALANVSLALAVRGVRRREARARGAAALADVGLACEVDAPVSALSLGQRQRVAVARALVGEPQILLADQPTSHQDPAGSAELAAVIARAQARGITAVVATNDPQVLRAGAARGWRCVVLRDRVAVEVDLNERWAALADPDYAPNAARAPATTHAAAQTAQAAHPTNVVPFPVTARAAGGYES